MPAKTPPSALNNHTKDNDRAESIDHVRIRFAGDSGDGMQLAGARFTEASAIFGNDVATYPSFPAEIRAPAGSLSGVSSFQIHIADRDILTAHDFHGLAYTQPYEVCDRCDA